jgi:hypothetical protein
MFDKWQEQLFVTSAYLPNLVNGKYQMMTARDRICGKGKEIETNQGTHPSFDCTQTVNEQGQQVQPLDALDAFATAIQQTIDNGTCQGPYMFAPPSSPQ